MKKRAICLGIVSILLVGCTSQEKLIFEPIKIVKGYSNIKVRPYLENALNAPSLAMSFTSSNQNIEISSNGEIYAKNAGESLIHIKTKNKTYKVNIEVTDHFEMSFEHLENIKKLASEKGLTNPTLFLGDSMFDYEHYYTDFYDVYKNKNALCAGISGATTHEMRSLINEWVVDLNPKEIVLCISCNNIDHLNESATQAWHNLYYLFQDIFEYLPGVNIYMMSITPSEDYFDNWETAQKVNSYIYEYAELDSRVTYVPMGEIFYEHFEKGSDCYLGDDMMHPSKLGYRATEQLLSEYLVIEDK